MKPKTYYVKHWLVEEYVPGLQGFCDEHVASYEFEDENDAVSFMMSKREKANMEKSWLSYRMCERYVPDFNPMQL